MGAQKIFGERGGVGEKGDQREREKWEEGERKVWPFSKSMNYPLRCLHQRDGSDQRLDLKSPT